MQTGSDFCESQTHAKIHPVFEVLHFNAGINQSTQQTSKEQTDTCRSSEEKGSLQGSRHVVFSLVSQ